LTAAIYTARAGLKVAVIEKEQCGGQAVMADLVENYPGFVGSGYELVEKTEAQATESGAEIIYDEIGSVELDGDVKRAVGIDGTYEAKTLIIATGASHKHAGFSGEEELAGAGVSYCATCDGAFFTGKDVAVIGGANTAVSEALYLANLCQKVYLIYRRDKLRADYTLVKRLEDTKNIEVIFNATPYEVVGDGKVEGLTYKTAEDTTGSLSVSGVFVAVGLTPATSLFKGKLTLDEGGYIKTSEVLATDIQGVYAVGDCRVKSLRQMVTAASDGAVAADSVIKSLISL
jgi:thioredoxin reductase (NADPH)